MTLLRRSFFAALLAGVLAGCAGPAATPAAAPAALPAVAPEIRQALAPTGTLRVAVYPGSPTSMVGGPAEQDMRGLSVELGRELARRLGVPAQIVVYPRVAEIVAALKAGNADFTITNASPARAKEVDFAPTLVSLELGYLALPGSPVADIAAVDKPGVRVGVTQGSTSQGVLTRDLKQASVVPAPTLKAAGEMLQARQLDAFATNKAILFELADTLPGARVLPGRWGLEHLAIAVPQGRGVAADYLKQFSAAVRSEGRVQRAAQNAGLRGLATD